MKNILITGSQGYIASNLVGWLRKDIYRIHGIDKRTGTPAEFLSDITDIDYIVHLAALSGIQACERNLEKAVKDNISSAFNVFSLASKKRIPVVFLSSQAAKEPTSSTYAMMKYMIEVQAEMLNKGGISDIKVLRLTNVYGGGDYLKKKNTVVKKFIQAYREGKPIIVDGSGEQTRDFIHVDDVCEYILRCIEMKNRIIRPVDIGTGIQTSINELVNMFDTDNVQYDLTSRSVGVETNVANIDKAYSIFGYNAPDRLEEYINEMKGKDNV